jgi:Transposase
LKSARVTLPEEPAEDVTCGIDCTRDDHALSVVNARGLGIHWCSVEHSAAGLRELVAVLARNGAREGRDRATRRAGRGHPAQRGITAVVINPSQVKNLRGRYGSVGSKDDRYDAYVMADTLRTDRARLAPLTPGSPAVVSLRRACRARKGLVGHRVAPANQLRAHLRNAFPGAVGLFAETDSPISLRFLARFESRDRADWLSPRRLASWLASVGYGGRTDPAVLHRRLAAAPRGDDGAAQTCNTRDLLTVLITLAEQIAEQLSLHADAPIFASLRPWTANLYSKAHRRGHDHPHAVRILARAWLFVIWPCWQDETAYDPARHQALQTLLNQNQQAAA